MLTCVSSSLNTPPGSIISRTHVDAFTEKEAQHPFGFRSADEIRNRPLKAKQEVDLRLSSKGIAGDFGAPDG
jgi:hypothetical protein